MMKWWIIVFLWVPLGVKASSRSFDGAEDAVTVTDHADFDIEHNEPHTLSLWIRPDTGNTATQAMITKQFQATDNIGYAYFSNFATADKFRNQINDSGGPDISLETTSTTSVNDGEWHNYTVTYDGSDAASGVTFYEDGVSLAMTTINDTVPGTIITTADVNFGQRDEASTLDYDGLQAHGHIFDREVAAGEMGDLIYSPERVANGRVLYLPLWEPQSNPTLLDHSGRGHDGTNTGTTASADGPPVFFGGNQ